MPTTDRAVSCSVEVAAAPQRVWELAADLPGMGRFSPENAGGQWVGGHEPRVGVRFVGHNARGWRRWRTTSRVVECQPGRSFAFRVSVAGLAVATWRYDVEPTSRGCRVTESWRDDRGTVMAVIGRLVTGEKDRAGYAQTSMQATLKGMKAVAEGSTSTSP